MSQSIADLTEALARNAEAVCRQYLSKGNREGLYWMVGDVRNTPGRSCFASSPDGTGFVQGILR